MRFMNIVTLKPPIFSNTFHNYIITKYRYKPINIIYRMIQISIFQSLKSIPRRSLKSLSLTNFSAANRSRLVHISLFNSSQVSRPPLGHSPTELSDHANESPARCIMYHRRITTVDDPRGSPAKKAIATWTRQ